MESITKLTSQLLGIGPLCDYCLGRQFARLGYDMPNKERGRALKIVLFLEYSMQNNIEAIKLLAERGGLEEAVEYLKKNGILVERQPCWLCGGVLSESRFTTLAEKIAEQLKQYEFGSFVIGASVPATMRENEDRLRSQLGIVTGEDLKKDITREVGKLVSKLTGKEISYGAYDITIIVDIFDETFRIIPSPLFIKGRYLKHSRQLPQSPWHCRMCWGRGCEACNYTGRKYPTSVAELIGERAKEIFQSDGYKFHAAGREDVDALVEGEGRPFVLELKRPRMRFVPLKQVEAEINKKANGLIEVVFDSLASRKEVRLLKLTSPSTSKTYVVKTVYDVDLDPSKIEKLEETFKNIVIEQRTPTRVLRRRSDKVRRKVVYWVEARLMDSRVAVFKICCQGGLYVKELITGDQGRTRPSFAEVLQATPSRLELTVVKVETVP